MLQLCLRCMAFGIGMWLVALVLAIAVGQTDSHVPLLAFVSERDGNQEIYLADVSRRLLANVSANPSGDTRPMWSADRQWLAFYSGRYNGSVMVFNPVRGRLNTVRSELIENPEFSWLSATNTLNIIVYQRRQGNYLNISANIVSGEVNIVEENINESEHFFVQPRAMSPDGRYIAYAERPNEATSFDIYVQDTITQEIIQITTHPSVDETPVWSSDGEWLAFVSYRDGNMEIYVYHFATGAMWNVSNHSRRDYNPSW